jgi:hypothetical protein
MLLTITTLLKLGALRSSMSESLTQLAVGIGSPTVLPISLPVALSVVVAGSVVEAAKVRHGTRIAMPSVIELLRTPAAIKSVLILTELGSRLTVRDKC